MEMVICRNCCGDAAQEISEESLLKLQSMLSELTHWSPEVCMACGTSAEQCRGYSLAALCCNDQLLAPPLMLCEICNGEIHAKLSRQTRESLGDFVRDNFPGVPADLDLIPSFL